MKLLQERQGYAVDELSPQAVDLLDLVVDPPEIGAEPESPLDKQKPEVPDARSLPAGRYPTERKSSQEQIRRRKVLAIRRQFQLGQYEVESRLAAILDKLLDDLKI